MRLPAGNGSSSPVSPIVCAALAASPGSSQSPCSASAASNRSSSARTPGSPQRSASMRARASGASESACSNKSRSVGVDSTAAVLRSHPKTFQKPFALSAASKARSQRAWENTERAVFRFRGAALRYAQHERFFIPEATPPINPARAPFATRGASFQMGLDEGAREAPVAVDRSEEHTSELQSPVHLVCRLLLEKKKKKHTAPIKRRITKQLDNTNISKDDMMINHKRCIV